MALEASDSPARLSDALVRNQVERILASQIFARSQRLCEFLRFIVDETLSGRGAALEEYVIASKVYEIQPGSESDGDAVVRVDARRIRDKLREFYSQANNEPVIVSLPEGRCTPVFQQNAVRREGFPSAPRLIREQLARILASSGFRNSDALQGMLRYIVEAALSGETDHLKEYTIGVEALGRPASFDPHQDTIVRVQARKLRERLSAWYAGEGANEPCHIVLRAGSYTPLFTAAEPAAAASTRTIAVLPFMNFTADHSAGYFCDGLAEELIDVLARTEGLRVIARTSSFQFKGTSADIREIGQRLGADLLIEGAVRNAGDRYRITARLLSAADGCEVWAGRYDRTVHDVLELESEVAAAVARSLSSGIPPLAPVMNSEGITLYLKARHAWNLRTADGFRRALELYSDAVRVNARAPKAWAGIAECHVLMMMHGLALPHACMPKAREAALEAIALDQDLASARSALAAVLALYDTNFQSAEEQWQRAITVDPAYATARHWYAMFGLVPICRLEDALTQIREAEKLDPLSAPIVNDVGFVLYWSRRFEEAIEQCRRAIALNPRFYRAYMLLARVYAVQGRQPEAIAAALTARELSDGIAFLPFLLGTLGFAYASAGDLANAHKVLEELQELETRGAVTAHERAIVTTGLGEWDEAARNSALAVNQRTGWAVWLPIEPLLDLLRVQRPVPELRSRERSRPVHS